MHGRFSFVVVELQPMYNELKSDKIPVLSHVSRFTECLLDALPEFKLQKLDHKKTITFTGNRESGKEQIKRNKSVSLLKVVPPICKQMS